MVRATIALFAGPDGLSVRLIEHLLSNFCFLKIFSGEKEIWEKALSHISQKSLYKIIDPKKEKEGAVFEYLIVLNHNLAFTLDEILENCRFAAAQSARILLVLPYVTANNKDWQERESIRGAVLKRIPEAGIIYSGDVFGPRQTEDKFGLLTRTLVSALKTGKVEDYGNEFFYPLSIEPFVRYLGRAVFSFGPYGKEIAVYSEKTYFHDFLKTLSKILGRELNLRKAKIERKEVLGVKMEVIKSDVKRGLEETILWLHQNLLNIALPRIKKRTPQTGQRAYFLKKGGFYGLIILLLLPFFLMAAGGSALFLSLKRPSIVTASLFFNRGSENFFQVFSRIPILGIVYKPFVTVSRAIFLSSEIGLSAKKAIDSSRALTALILGNTTFEPADLTNEISLELGDIYNKTGLLLTEIKGLPNFADRSISRFISVEELETLRGKVLEGKRLVEKLPEILGSESPKAYLVLFQNNMELRPTGGFIGSFALVSFDAGRLVDINVMDVYAADGQLKGHVEPPEPIKKYLGEANWFLRDSNWDPDFPTSAARAQWFLDKEIDETVDGVIGVDLEVAKGILFVTGPVILPDFNQVFDYKNLYDRLQDEVEEEFFPGSQKKASIMTALTRELVNRLSEMEENKYIPVAKEAASALEERHIQLYFNEQETQGIVSKLGYSGEIGIPSCSSSCTPDWYSVVDANVGVNKANYFIKRSFDLEATITGGVVRKTLQVIYENGSNPAIGQAGRYKTYTRLLVPENSKLDQVKIETAGTFVLADLETQSLPGRKEGGISIEVSPGQTKSLLFSWETPIKEGSSEYFLYIRKQAGTVSDPLSASILTAEGSYSYNTNLARDFFARIFFP